MYIHFTDSLLLAKANSFKQLVEEYGQMKAVRIRQRLAEISAAENLYDLSRVPTTKCICISEEENLIGVNTLESRYISFGVEGDFLPRYAAEITNWC
jgi:hypothetical protein